jgi:hypothetical protein
VPAVAIQRRRNVLFIGDKTHFSLLYGNSLEGVRVDFPASLGKQLDSESTDLASAVS